tara:strand:+ start:546 stop:1256 length:711 start_codon:yes stop_codon:yes gene_type:complete
MSVEGCIRKECISRIISDVKEITVNPLHEQNIYYQHDEDNILNGYALIIGTKDTPYENGYYFFRFVFPIDYPYKPPTVYYLTNDGITRFHPNLYRNGKCCLSILNTWKGDEWTSCITLSTILLSLCILFTDNPLIHEPGISKNHNEIEYYNDIIKYKNYEVAFYGILKKRGFIYNLFSNFIEKHFIENKSDILNNLENENKRNKKVKKITVSVYDMIDIEINYSKLIKNIKKIEIK